MFSKVVSALALVVSLSGCITDKSIKKDVGVNVDGNSKIAYAAVARANYVAIAAKAEKAKARLADAIAHANVAREAVRKAKTNVVSANVSVLSDARNALDDAVDAVDIATSNARNAAFNAACARYYLATAIQAVDDAEQTSEPHPLFAKKAGK